MVIFSANEINYTEGCVMGATVHVQIMFCHDTFQGRDTDE